MGKIREALEKDIEATELLLLELTEMENRTESLEELVIQLKEENERLVNKANGLNAIAKGQREVLNFIAQTAQSRALGETAQTVAAGGSKTAGKGFVPREHWEEKEMILERGD